MTHLLSRRKVLFVVFVAFILYLFLRLKYYKIKYETVIHEARPFEVWNFVADFGNMLKLNPTIMDFHVHEEGGDYNSWLYTVTYTEHLSHIPFVYNYGYAEFNVKPHVNSVFLIESTHRTCFFTTFICLNSKSQLRFEPDGKEDNEKTKYLENITYQCPVLLSFLCKWEVLYQREMITKNLNKEFRERDS